MSFWRTFFLGLAALGLGAYIYFVEQPRIEREAAPDQIVSFDMAAVQSVSLRYPDQPEIELVKSGEAWRLREPIDFEADASTIERLLQQILDTKVERRIKTSEAEAPSVYGLDGNGTQARVVIRMQDGTSLPALIVGGTTPVGYNAFARLEGHDEILVIPLLLHTGVRKTVFDVRDKVLFDADTANATALELNNGGRVVRMERRGDAWWILADSSELLGDADQARSLVSALNGIRAIAFHDDTVAEDDGTDEPLLSFSATFGDSGTQGFSLGRKVDDGGAAGYYLRRLSDNLVVTVEDALRTRFDKDRSDLRDKRLFRCAAEAVNEARFDRSDGAGFALVKKEGGWAVQPATEGSTTRTKIAERTVVGLATLAGNEIVAETATEPSALEPFGLTHPDVEVEVVGRDGATCGRALVGVVGSDSATPAYYVKRADEDVVMSIPAYLYSRLDVRRSDVLDTPAAPPAESSETP